MKLQIPALLPAVMLLLLPSSESIQAQTTAFTYQGKLTDQGAPVSGVYDFTFTLFDDAAGGNAVSGPLTNSSVPVVAGAFSIAVDFGVNFPGTDRWIGIGVRTNGSGAFIVLLPRQKVTSTPYAITAGNLTGSIAPAQLGRLTNHLDVSAMGLAAGHILVYDGAFWTNAAVAATGNVGTNNIPVVLTFSGTNVPVSASAGAHYRLIATNNFLLQNPSGAIDGQRLVFELIQDGVGGRTMVLGNAYKLGLDLPVLNLTTNANGRDFMTCIASGTNFYIVGFIKGF